MIKYIFFPLLILLLINASCDNTNSEGDKNPREYTFTFDTLVSHYNSSREYQTMMNHIWGNSLDDVWASGHCSGAEDIFHYDGISWNPAQTSPAVYGGMEGEVFGFGQNNIWVVGRYGSSGDSIHGYSRIGHYDGNNWERADIPDKTGRELLTIWGKESK